MRILRIVCGFSESWGRTQRLRLERQKKFEEEQQQVHTEKQLRHRGRRLVDLENAAERLESEPLKKGCKAWRVQQALVIHGPKTIVASASQVAPIVAALSDRYSVQIWVPDDDPRPGASHSAAACSWNLERDMLDRLYPNPNRSITLVKSSVMLLVYKASSC